MKTKLIKTGAVLLCAFAVCSVFSLSFVSHSQNNDPLITLSYLNEIVLPQFRTEVLGDVDKKLNGSYVPNSSQPITTPVVDNTQQNTEATTAPSEVNTSYTLLELTLGQCVYTNSTLELIVRPGSEVYAVSPFPEQGIANITHGKEYLNGDRIDINAYCLIPRGGDGRGFYVNNEKSYILVRGEYYIG